METSSGNESCGSSCYSGYANHATSAESWECMVYSLDVLVLEKDSVSKGDSVSIGDLHLVLTTAQVASYYSSCSVLNPVVSMDPTPPYTRFEKRAPDYWIVVIAGCPEDILRQVELLRLQSWHVIAQIPDGGDLSYVDGHWVKQVDTVTLLADLPSFLGTQRPIRSPVKPTPIDSAEELVPLSVASPVKSNCDADFEMDHDSVSETIQFPNHHVGAIIGSHGHRIQNIRTASQCIVHIPTDSVAYSKLKSRKHCQNVTLMGTKVQVLQAKVMIRRILEMER